MKQLLINSIIMLGAEMNELTDLLNSLISQFWGPLIAIFVTAAGIWGAWLGWKFWSAGGDEQKKKSAKSATTSFVVGIIVMFVIAAGVPVFTSILTSWVANN